MSKEDHVCEAILSAAKTLAERSSMGSKSEGLAELQTSEAVLNLVKALCMLRASVSVSVG
jgi:hypothetical protein